MINFIDYIKLVYRANRYKNKTDKGGIAFVGDKVRNGHTVLDIGAHKAGYLFFIRKQAGETGRIYAFEPQTSLFTYLQKIKRLFGWHNVVLEQLALSDEAGKATLFVPASSRDKSSSPGATIVQKLAESGFQPREEIKTDTLDAYCSNRDIRPDFIKIDVEGNELPLLRGGRQTLLAYKPAVIVEIEERHVGRQRVLETFEFMLELGYSGYFIHGRQRLPLKDFSFEKYQNLDDTGNYCNNFTFE